MAKRNETIDEICIANIAQSGFESMIEDVEFEGNCPYERLIYKERKAFLYGLKEQLNKLIDEELNDLEKNKKDIKDELAILKAENRRLKYKLEHAHDWDNYDPSCEMGQ